MTDQIKGYKDQEEQRDPLTGKWGCHDPRALHALETTRRNNISTIYSIWDSLTDSQRAYWIEVLEFESLWKRGINTDWRVYWNQPQSKGLESDGTVRDGWWRDRPVEPPANVSEMIREVFKDATITQPLEYMYRRKDGIQEPR